MMSRISQSVKMSFFPLIASLLFFIGGVVTAVFSDDFFSAAPYNGSAGAVELLKNNAIACLFLTAGFFTFGLTSIFYLFSNGFILSGSIIESLHNGVPFYQIILLLIPHGIFEVPALLLSGAIGFKSVELVIRLCFSKQKKIMITMFKHMGIMVLCIICLLIAAAIVEAYITPIFK
ncbi:stage II sporulation protein M [Bacillus nakamurai]|uniref:stage II sporulation protein M n=1 Tax=Bacillus nakamurai TaxID=1793963 RepID=UPI001E2A9829|nr:stage II sporulation protein M [Bacillus nakamurai]MCC9023247.1 stage II sporulation protein M [Bacillus nakamurai]